MAGYLGSIAGITLSYFLGFIAGKYLLARFEKKDFVKKNVTRVRTWFDRFGKWTLLIGYFIPGVRHFTGCSAGMMKMEFKKFALFAYTGAVIWVSVFISTGYFFGNYCFSFLEKLDVDVSLLAGIVIFCFLIYVIIIRLWKKNKKKG